MGMLYLVHIYICIHTHTHTHTHINRSNVYPLLFTVKYSQGQSSGSCMGETGEREGRVGVICESDLGWRVFIDIACSNAVGKLALWR